MKKAIINMNHSGKAPYQKPEVKVYIIRQRYQLLAYSRDEYGMRRRLVEDEEVDEAM